MNKTFVLDTNVILHNPHSLESFADNIVLLPIEVLEELDRFKNKSDEKGRNARVAIRLLDQYRRAGAPGEGFPIGNGGILKVSTGLDYSRVSREVGLDVGIIDNKILLTAYLAKQKGEEVRFVSKDINARIKAAAIGLICVDFEKQKVDFDKLYTGWRTVEVSKKVIDDFYEKKELPVSQNDYIANEFVMLSEKGNPKHTALGRYQEELSILMPCIHSKAHTTEIKPRNVEQAMALELLLNDDIPLVTLLGQAGTGKTLLALAAGLHKVVKDKTFSRLLVSRPLLPLGKDIGYLPGSKEEKLESWMGPIFDNLEYISSYEKTPKGSKVKGKGRMEKYLKDELIEMEAMTFMRGRSIANQFIIIDEAQNMTPHEVKTVISRAGNNTKMILTGDPNQIDSPYLDSSSNGLSYCVERMKGQKMFGHMTLTKSERSSLASLAAELL